jgi:hypothetical protein
MSQMIESVESRILFIASAGVIEADFEALLAAGLTGKVELKASVAQANADTKAVKAAVAAAHPTSAQKATLGRLAKDAVSTIGKYKAKVSAAYSSGDHGGTALLSALEGLKAHPTSAAALAKVDADVAKLQALFSDTNITTLENAASSTVTTLDTDLNGVATAVPSASTATGTFETHLAADLTSLSTDLTGIQTALGNLATALS